MATKTIAKKKKQTKNVLRTDASISNAFQVMNKIQNNITSAYQAMVEADEEFMQVIKRVSPG